MSNKNMVVGADLKPTPERLLQMLEKFDDRQAVEIRKQFVRGVLNNEHVQALIEHRNPFVWPKPPRPPLGPLDRVITDCQRAMRRTFGRHCPEVGPLPASVTEKQVAHWARYNMCPVWLPELDLAETGRLPKKWIRLGATFYKWLKAGKIGEAIPSVPPTRLQAGWYLADLSVGIDYTDGTQVFPNDPWAPLFKRLRREKLVGKYDETPLESRFAITHDEWIQVVLGFMASELSFPRSNLCLERASEFNAIGNIYDPNRGACNIWVWLADPFGGSSRLIGGSRDDGGLANINYNWHDNRAWNIAARPLVVL